MITSTRNKFFFGFFLLFTFIFSMVYYIFMGHNKPFSCNSFVRYEIDIRFKKVIFNLSQNIFIKSNRGGYIIFSGRVLHDETNYKVNRRLDFLSKGKYNKDILENNISGIHKSVSDSVPDYIFNALISEIIPTGNMFNLQIVTLDNDSYLLRGPLSNLFVCVER